MENMKLRGRVVQGLGLGTKLGYPTANLKLSFDQPRSTKLSFDQWSGVYAARATVGGTTYNAALVIGARYENGQSLIEVHLLDFHDNLYGKALTVEVLDKISPIKLLSNPRDLKKKITQDVEKIKKFFSYEKSAG